MTTHRRLVATFAAATLLTLGALAPVGAQETDLADDGRFLAPFAEPTVAGVATAETCVEASDGTLHCKPAAGSVAILPQDPDHVVYFNALEGTENVRGSIVAEFGNVSINAQARLLDLNGGDPVWTPTDAVDSGANREGYDNSYLVPGDLLNSTETYNDGSLFCADLNFLPDGRVMTVGGTSYYAEPGNDAVPLGVVELEGTDNTRVYDPDTNTWAELDPMEFGRWYPTLATLADGHQFVASGVEKLLKPVYPDHPQDSGRNVIQTEVFDPASGSWTYTGASGDRSLPLYPRLHLLPNGQVYYNAAGQVFNPAGQAYDEALWNIAAAFDPETSTWSDLGVPGLTELSSLDESPDRAAQVLPHDLAATFTEMTERGQSATQALVSGLQAQDMGPAMQEALGVMSAQGLEGLGSVLGAGFRGSTFSIMLPLEPDEDGQYRTSEFLTSGGIVGPTPGTYLPVPFSRIDTVETEGPAMELSSRFTGSLDTGRWYSTGVLLPTGEVLALNGSTADEVVNPGSGFPINEAELFDPETETWRTVATQHRDRAYHNTAALMPDGRVLVGGHDMISTAYGSNYTIPGGFTPTGRDPSFELFEPPYLHYGMDQPVIRNADSVRGEVTLGQRLDLALDIPADEVDSVMLVRNPSLTHLVDADQRSVSLPVTATDGKRVTVDVPDEAAVLPPGPYMLFVNRATGQGPVPSHSVQVSVPGPDAPAGEERTAEAVGDRSESSDPGLTNGIPPAEDVLAHGEPVPPTDNTDPYQPVEETSPPAHVRATSVATSALPAPPAQLDAAAVRVDAVQPLDDGTRSRTALVALAATGVLVGAVSHVRVLARRRAWLSG